MKNKLKTFHDGHIRLWDDLARSGSDEKKSSKIWKDPDNMICPVCQTNTQDYCVLLGIDGTQEDGIEEGKPVHLHCAIARRYNKQAGIIYRRTS